MLFLCRKEFYEKSLCRPLQKRMGTILGFSFGRYPLLSLFLQPSMDQSICFPHRGHCTHLCLQRGCVRAGLDHRLQRFLRCDLLPLSILRRNAHLPWYDCTYGALRCHLLDPPSLCRCTAGGGGEAALPSGNLFSWDRDDRSHPSFLFYSRCSGYGKLNVKHRIGSHQLCSLLPHLAAKQLLRFSLQCKRLRPHRLMDLCKHGRSGISPYDLLLFDVFMQRSLRIFQLAAHPKTAGIQGIKKLFLPLFALQLLQCLLNGVIRYYGILHLPNGRFHRAKSGFGSVADGRNQQCIFYSNIMLFQ